MKGNLSDEKAFWDRRAKNYPRPFAREIRAKTARIIRLLEGMGARFEGARLLDIGTGTGVYALHLAGRAKKVLGVDSSREMLKLFRAEARRRGLRNAACRAGLWRDLPAAGLAGRFDIALASMTAAVKTRAEVLNMERAAPLRVYIGWAGVRRNPLMKKVYARHGLDYKAPEGALAVLEALRALGRKPKVKYIRDSWTVSHTAAETLAEIEVWLDMNGVRPDRPWLEKLLRRLARGGKVAQRVTARKALLVW